MDPKITLELSRTSPSIPFRASPSHVHHTWARTFYSRPELYIQPHTIAEVEKAVNLARRCRRRIVVVGSGHSPSDITCSSAWMMNLDKMDQIQDIEWDGEDGNSAATVRVESGIRLRNLTVELEKRGLALPNLGSIDEQSIAGVISTGTHGSSLKFGLLSQNVVGLAITLANGQTVRCSKESNTKLFRAALISLGALGIVVELTLRVVPKFNIEWRQALHPLDDILARWNGNLWTEKEYVRVWWMPYMKRAIVWQASPTDKPVKAPPSSFYGGKLGYHIYHNLLALSRYVPQILPWVEWFIFGMQYGFRPGKTVTTAVEPVRQGLLMDCLYSQFVNEWALPLEKGPEAIRRLSAWIHGDEKTAQIPFSSKGVYVHCPIEVRVSDTSRADPRPYLDPTNKAGPTLYLNATLYRPYGRDPPGYERYYEAFEWLVREMGGRPHWAKNFQTAGYPDFKELYGTDLDQWLQTRQEVDPDGLFLGEWHRRTLLPLTSGLKPADCLPPLLELEAKRQPMKSQGSGDGLEWVGEKAWEVDADEEVIPGLKHQYIALTDNGSVGESPSPPMTATSEESFDYLAKGEASVYGEL